MGFLDYFYTGKYADCINGTKIMYFQKTHNCFKLKYFIYQLNNFSFVMLFIYVVLSLFIAIIMDTYENIKEYYKVS